MIFARSRKTVAAFLQMLTIFAVLMVPNMSAGQDRTQKSIITQILWQSLLKCYSVPEENIRQDDMVILQVELGVNGDLADLPHIITPSRFSVGERALLREAVSALIMCTPLISGGGDKAIYGDFQVIVNLDGFSLANVNAQVGAPDIDPTVESEDVQEETETAEPDTEEPTTIAENAEATLEDEDALELSKTDRRELQRRLSLLDYNTRGVDGVFGPGSRKAVQSWQTDNALTPTGFFDANQVAFLREMSETKYVAWKSRPTRYTDRNGCLREASGQIIQGRSFKCDLNAAGQSIGVSR